MSASESGWIKLHRCLMDKAVWTQSKLEYKVILITILMMANHTEKQWVWNGKKFEAKPGQFVTSLPSIAQKSGASIQNVRSALNFLKKCEFLTDESTKTGRLITIVNWGLYQGYNEETNRQVNSQSTDDQQTPNRQVTANKNDKNVKKNTLIDFYHDLFLEKFGVKPSINGAKDGAIFKKLLGTYSDEQLRELLKKFFASEDKFIKDSGYTVGVFKSVLNKLLIDGKQNQDPAYSATQASRNMYGG